MLRIPTTRGDRLFISLLGAAFIHLAWLGSSAQACGGLPAFRFSTRRRVFRFV